jgi:hypothetical protein
MAALAARKFSLFPQATSRTLLSRTIFQSQLTFHRDSIFSTPTTPSSRSTSTTQFSSRTTSWRHPSVKPNQGGSEPRPRRSYVGGYHTHSDELLLSTLESPRDVIQARTRSDQYSQYRTLRGAETGQAAPVISDPINVVLSFELWHLFLPSVLQSGHQKSVCGRPAFWVVIVPLK